MIRNIVTAAAGRSRGVAIYPAGITNVTSALTAVSGSELSGPAATDGAGVIVIIGSLGNCYRSTDGGRTWAKHTITWGTTFNGVQAIWWGNGKFWIMHNGGWLMFSSPDGITWTGLGAVAPVNQTTGDASWNGTYHSCRQSTLAGGYAYSTNGTTWTETGTGTISGQATGFCAAPSNGTVIEVGGSASCWTAPNMTGARVSRTSLVFAAFGNQNGTLSNMVHDGTKFVCSGTAASTIFILTTVDGSSWTTVMSGNSSTVPSGYIRYSAGTYYSYLGGTAAFVTSTNLTTWTSRVTDITAVMGSNVSAQPTLVSSLGAFILRNNAGGTAMVAYLARY